jgi:agmatinase
MTNKDPSQVAVKNNQLFGLEVSFQEAKLLCNNISWDVTTSYRAGTVNGPSAILDASYQLDLVSPLLPNAWELSLHTLPIDQSCLKKSTDLRVKSARIIRALEAGHKISHQPDLLKDLEDINLACAQLSESTYQATLQWLKQNKKTLTLGGDHAISLGPIKAYAEFYPDLSILHFDAHADLRNAYEGFKESHASIMFNVMETAPVKSLVQVGIRDVSPIEIEYSNSKENIHTHFDWSIKSQLSEGKSWNEISDNLIKPLSENVYISFDIDGLDPKLCPNTGTPVPGGLELWQVQILIERVLASGRKIVGADLVEVAPGPNGDQWDGNVGARCAFMLACAIAKSI